MNLYFVLDPENENYLTPRYKWTPHMYKARFFTTISNANKARADMRKKLPAKKYIVQQYELIYQKDR